MRERDDDLLELTAGLDDVAVLGELVLPERDGELRDGDRYLDDAGHRLRRFRVRADIDVAFEAERLTARGDRGRVVLPGETHGRTL